MNSMQKMQEKKKVKGVCCLTQSGYRAVSRNANTRNRERGQSENAITVECKDKSKQIVCMHEVLLFDFYSERIQTYLETVVWPVDETFCRDWWITCIVMSTRCWWRQRNHRYWLFHWTSWENLFISHWSFHCVSVYLPISVSFYLIILFR